MHIKYCGRYIHVPIQFQACLFFGSSMFMLLNITIDTIHGLISLSSDGWDSKEVAIDSTPGSDKNCRRAIAFQNINPVIAWWKGGGSNYMVPPA